MFPTKRSFRQMQIERERVKERETHTQTDIHKIVSERQKRQSDR